jgi:CRP-like cAMP-binding protein
MPLTAAEVAPRAAATTDRASPARSPAPAGDVVRVFDPGAMIVEDGDSTPRLRLLTSGWAARIRLLSDGRRQILRLLMPGDICSLPPSAWSPGGCAVQALTAARVADQALSAEMMDPESPANARLRALVAGSAMGERAGLLSQLVRLGRLTAYERTAHLLLELMERATGAGLADGRTMLLPVRQEALADTLGLSTVHMNRTLKQLQRDGAISYRAGRYTLHDPQRLAERCSFQFESPLNGAPASGPGAGVDRSSHQRRRSGEPLRTFAAGL